jgi:hypothetical protein
MIIAVDGGSHGNISIVELLGKVQELVAFIWVRGEAGEIERGSAWSGGVGEVGRGGAHAAGTKAV